MEIDITSLLEMDAFNLSHSRMEGGDNAGINTWNASKEQAKETPLLDTEEKLQAMREFVKESGGWDKEEIAEWDSNELNALFLQWIAGDVRELPSIEQEFDENDSRFSTAYSLDEIDWVKAEEMQAEGQAPSNLFRADDGRIFFYLGH
jgi:hypothetical protein